MSHAVGRIVIVIGSESDRLQSPPTYRRADDLREPDRVGVQVDRFRRQHDRQLVAHRLGQRSNDFDRALRGRCQFNPPAPQLNLSVTDAAHAEKRGGTLRDVTGQSSSQ